MSKNETSTDKIKKLLAEQGAGGDWLRRSRKKNGEGQWVRQFENKQSGARLEVVELPGGRFVARPLTEAANAAFPKPAGSFPAGSFLETDPEKNKAADKVMATRYGDVSEALLKKAGKALANRYTFAVTDEGAEDFDISFYAIITPTKYLKDEGCVYDQPSPIGHLLPDGEDANDCGTWIFDKNYPSATALAKDLKARGFIWDRDFQDAINDKFTAELSPAPSAPSHSKAATPSAPSCSKAATPPGPPDPPQTPRTPGCPPCGR